MRILITAGPTREAIDPVRYISNRSSGRMGYALAAQAHARGHEVLLVSGPVGIASPEGCEKVAVESAQEMFDAVERLVDGCEAVVMSAAVADYAPVHPQRQKIKKSADDLVLELAKTRDILAAMRGEFKFKGLLVGFAAETENMRGNALEKMRGKGCDLVVANDVSRSDIGFDSEYNAVIIFGADGSEQIVSRQLKQDVAISILAAMESAAAK